MTLKKWLPTTRIQNFYHLSFKCIDRKGKTATSNASVVQTCSEYMWEMEILLTVETSNGFILDRDFAMEEDSNVTHHFLTGYLDSTLCCMG